MIGRVVAAAVIGGTLGAGAVSAVHALKAPDDSGAAFADRWLALHTRCRTAIETAGSIEQEGLTQVTTLKRDGLERDIPADSSAWQDADDDRVVLIEFPPTETNGGLRGCRIELADDMLAVHPQAVGSVVKSFLEERSSLVTQGSHMLRDPDPITPGFGLGYEAVAPNPEGCMAVTSAFFDPVRGINLLTSIESLDLPCRDHSQISHDGKAYA